MPSNVISARESFRWVVGDGHKERLWLVCVHRGVHGKRIAQTMAIDLSTSTLLYFSRGMETLHKPAGESAAAEPTVQSAQRCLHLWLNWSIPTNLSNCFWTRWFCPEYSVCTKGTWTSDRRDWPQETISDFACLLEYLHHPKDSPHDKGEKDPMHIHSEQLVFQADCLLERAVHGWTDAQEPCVGIIWCIVSQNKQQRLKERGRRESEKMSETGQDAAGRKYSARNYLVKTQQRVLLSPKL